MLGKKKQSDTSLVRYAVEGDQEAFVVLVQRYQGMVSGITLAILRDFGASEDAAQETFVLAWKKISTLKEISKWKPWLAQLARNTAINHLRKRKQKEGTEALGESFIDARARPDEVAQLKDEASLVLAALEQLPEKFRLPLVLYYREEKSVAAVAASLGLSQDAVKQRLKRGRDSLRGEVETSLGRALVRTAPTMAFTVSVATVLSGAGTTTGAAATGIAVSFVTNPSASTSGLLVMMNSTKVSLSAAALIGVLAVPAGYGLSKMMSVESGDSLPQKTRSASLASQSTVRTQNPIPPSQVGDEWNRLKEKFGGDAEAMPLIYEEILKKEDRYLREGLATLLMARWVEVDALGGFDFLVEQGDDVWRIALTEEWLRLDAEASVAGIQSGKRWANHLADASVVLAEKAPEFFLKNYRRLRSRFGDNGERALRILAEYDHLALRDQSLGKYDRRELRAALEVWGEKDGVSALEWALTLEGAGAVAAQAAALSGWVRADPEAGLARLAELPPSVFRHFNEGHFFASIVSEIAEEDLDAALQWCQTFSERNYRLYSSSMRVLVAKGLSNNPSEFLDKANDFGLLEQVGKQFRLEIGRESVHQWREIARWVEELPAGQIRNQMVSGLAENLATNHPRDAIEFLNDYRDDDLRGELRVSVARRLKLSPSLEDLNYYRSNHPDLVDELVLTTFHSWGAAQPFSQDVKGYPVDMEPWLKEAERFAPEEIPPSFLAASLRWNPEQAMAWFNEASSANFDFAQKQPYFGNSFSNWYRSHQEDALAWLAEGRAGEYSDVGATKVVADLSQNTNGDRTVTDWWPWFESIESVEFREEAFQSIIRNQGEEQLDEVSALIGELEISEAEKGYYLQRIAAKEVK